MKYLLLIKILRHIGEARRVCQILLSFLSEIVRIVFSLCSGDLVCVANCFESNSSWSSILRISSALHLLAVVSQTESKTAKEVVRNAAIGKVSGWIDVGAYAVESYTGRSRAETSGRTFSVERVLKGNAKEELRLEGKAKNDWVSELRRRKKEKSWSENRSTGSGNTITVMHIVADWRIFEFVEEKCSNSINFEEQSVLSYHLIQWFLCYVLSMLEDAYCRFNGDLPECAISPVVPTAVSFR